MSDTKLVPSFVNGREVDSSAHFEKFNPATGEVSAEVTESSSELVDRAVESARAAYNGEWANSTMTQRAALLERIADVLDEHIDELVADEIADTGKPLTATRNIEIPRAIANFRAFAERARATQFETFETPMSDGRTARNVTVREPIGVVGIVAPWNLPLLLLTFKVAPALACGNSIVVKPSEHSPRTAVLLAKLAIKAGLPEGVLNVVQGHGHNAAGSFLTGHMDVNALTFTGETRTGEAIMRAGAAGPRPVSLELGGKNASIVFDDCDLEAAAAGTVRSMFDNCGQVCLTTERLFVHRSIFERFVNRVAELSANLVPGNPLDPSTTLGPAISSIQRDKVLGAYRTAREAGANVIIGGGALEMPAPLSNGYWVQPTIWTGLPDDADACRNEVFGPCAHFAVFDDEDEVVRRANDTKYGLASVVWTKDANRGARIAARLRTGTVWVNCWRVRDERAPFGGFKQSGVGREGGAWSLDFYSEVKNICTAG